MATVLTVCQPWAHCILYHGKNVENRTWPTPFRGRLYIHAGKSRQWMKRAQEIDWPTTFGVEMPSYADLDFGAILGYVDVVDCVPIADLRPASVFNVPWASGPWCWILRNPVALRSPISHKGRLTLWNVADEIVEHKRRTAPLLN